MKRIISLIAVFTLLLTLAVPFFSVGADATVLTEVTSVPEAFANCTPVEAETGYNASTPGHKINTNNAQVGYYVSLGAGGTSIAVPFTVPVAGTYDFLLVLPAFASGNTASRKGSFQIDNGEIVAHTVDFAGKNDVDLYFTGLSAELSAGEHTLTLHAPADFDGNTVKSLYFNKFYFVKRTTTTPTPSTPPTTETVIKFTTTGDVQYAYVKMPTAAGPDANWKFCYDVYLEDDVAGIGAANPHYGLNAIRDVNVNDQNGIDCHPRSDISELAHKKWYSREIPLNNYAAAAYTHILFAAETENGGTAYFKNICFKNAAGEVVHTFTFSDTLEVEPHPGFPLPTLQLHELETTPGTTTPGTTTPGTTTPGTTPTPTTTPSTSAPGGDNPSTGNELISFAVLATASLAALFVTAKAKKHHQ